MKKISVLFLLFLLLPLNFVKAADLSSMLRGRILLQVEAKGEAWYVNPVSLSRFYLGRPDDAFRVMREQGLGITEKDYAAFKGVASVRLAGKILLRVNAHGEAYYVNPLDLRMHYLGRPADAFNVMRTLGLGITNSNLNLISVDKNSSPVLAADSGQDGQAENPAGDENTAPETGDQPVATSTPDQTPPETATSTEVTAAACLWQIEYFDNKVLFGEPIATATSQTLDFDWAGEGPAGVGKVDNYSARFTASCDFEEGNYEFRTVFDDAIKVYLDGENFMQSWADNNREMIFNRERNVAAGVHEVKVEFYEALRFAKIKVSWEKLN